MTMFDWPTITNSSVTQSVPDSVPDLLHFAALWCGAVLTAKSLSQTISARCSSLHFAAAFSDGF
jgi:hypothetical protein